nr:bifunctional folylpolyglutamate synthase/dihydrofolate synthase [Betaproteobacteria bacterium]
RVPGPRGAEAAALRGALINAGINASAIRVFGDVGEALSAARESADEADRIVVFGSFLTVAAALGLKE